MGGTGYPTRRIAPAHALLGAVALLALVVVPVAATASDSTGPDAAASAGVKKKVKKLKKRVKGLEGRLIELEAEQGGQRPPTGPASGDLAGSYPGPAIAGDAVDSAKVAPDSLRGPDIDESSLGQVPSAGSASNANAVDGVDAANVEYKSDVDSTPTTILNLPGLQLRASCAGGNLQVQALTSVDNALLNSG